MLILRQEFQNGTVDYSWSIMHSDETDNYRINQIKKKIMHIIFPAGSNILSWVVRDNVIITMYIIKFIEYPKMFYDFN